MAVLGVDGGGRKTHAAVADLDGTLLGVGQAGGSNWEIVGLDAALAAIAEASDRALASAGLGRGGVHVQVPRPARHEWPARGRGQDRRRALVFPLSPARPLSSRGEVSFTMTGRLTR